VRLAPFYSWTKEVKRTDTLAEVVSHSDGLTFVVDDGLIETVEEQQSMREVIAMVLEAARPTAPILVLSFAPNDVHACDPRRVMALLGLDVLLGRAVCVRNVPESTDSGVAEGFEWLTDVMTSV
jgi:hypothetical protein